MSSDLTLEPPCLTSTAHCLQALRKLGATGDKKQMQSLCVFIPHPGHEASDDLCSISCPVLEERSAPSTKGVREISNACLSHLWVCLLALRTPGIPAKEGLSLRPGLWGKCATSFRIDGSLVCNCARHCFIRSIYINFLVFFGSRPFH